MANKLELNQSIIERKNETLKLVVYEEMSNHTTSGKSLESIHDTIHDNIGGITGIKRLEGQMTNPLCAAFDPIFFLHHCNVDRLFALWQSLYPNSWFHDEKESTKNLTPFHIKEPNYPYVNSNDMKNWEQWGYFYQGISFSDPLALRKFFPLSTLRKKPKYFWNLHFPSIDRRNYGGSFEIRAFLKTDDFKIRTKTSNTNPRYIGSISIFAVSKNVECNTCSQAEEQRGDLPLNSTMKRLKFDINNVGLKGEIEQRILLIYNMHEDIIKKEVSFKYEVQVFDNVSTILKEVEKSDESEEEKIKETFRKFPERKLE